MRTLVADDDDDPRRLPDHQSADTMLPRSWFIVCTFSAEPHHEHDDARVTDIFLMTRLTVVKL